MVETICILILILSQVEQYIFEDCWSRGGFLTWFNMVKGGGVGSTREIMAILLFKNNYGRIVYRKVLRVRYFRL